MLRRIREIWNEYGAEAESSMIKAQSFIEK
jgi:hypothetical protein